MVDEPIESDSELSLDDLRASLQSGPVQLAAKSATWLPLEDLDPAVFERLVAEVVQGFASPTVHFYGRGGQRQYGLDIYEERRDGTRVVYQAKRFQEIGAGDLAPILEDYLHPKSRATEGPTSSPSEDSGSAEPTEQPRFDAHEFVIVTSALADDDTARTDALRALQKLHAKRLTIALWGKERLSRQLRAMPNLVMVIFGEAWAREWCGADAVRDAVADVERKDRVHRALQGAMTVQFDKDKEIRFRQIELSGVTVNSLFVDVPVTAAPASDAEQMLSEINPQPPELSERPLAGAAQVLLHPRWDRSTVILGGPGQGKTTLLQFLCQFHRARALKIDEYSPIASGLDPVSEVERIALKIDLTEYAEWRRSILSVQSAADPTTPVEPDRVPGLLQHAAGLISTLSAVKMTVEDFAYAAGSRPMFIALDSLDEVADPKERDQVTDEIRTFESQLRSSAVDVMLVVATRPGNVGRPIWRDTQFTALSLERLTAPLRFAYLDRWLKQSKLTEREIQDLRTSFAKNIMSPHVEDLAGNPMQLAILLHLMQRRTVLPEKRTDLHEKYIDVFMDRESKTQIVADNKDIILRFHKLLAWHIHCEVERGRSKGTVTLDALKAILTNYLVPRGKDIAFIQELFGSVTTRVLCLVPKDLNAQEFQFEVQPLREYFAAEWVYDVLPAKDKDTTPAGVLQVLARRPYWLNVLRFFAGRMRSSEVASVFYALDELLQDKNIGPLPLARSIAKLLLDDQVFAGQYEKVFQDIVGLILGGSGVTFAAFDLIEQASGTSFTFKDETAAKTGTSFLLDLLADEHSDFVSICRVLNAISSGTALEAWVSKRTQIEPNRWLSVACRLGLSAGRGRLKAEELDVALKAVRTSDTPALLPHLIAARATASEDWVATCCMEELATGRVPLVRSRTNAATFAELSYFASPERLYDALDWRRGGTTARVSAGPRPKSTKAATSSKEGPREPQADDMVGRTTVQLREVFNPSAMWVADVTWFNALDSLAAVWGETAPILRQLVLALPLEYCLRFSSEPLLKDPLAWRSLAGWRWMAEQNSSTTTWWEQELALISEPDQMLSFFFSLIRDARSEPAVAMMPKLNSALEALSTTEWELIVAATHRDLRRNRGAPASTTLSEALRLNQTEPSPRSAVLFWPFATGAGRARLNSRILSAIETCWSNDPAVAAVLGAVLEGQAKKLNPELFRGARGTFSGSVSMPAGLGVMTYALAESILMTPSEWPQGVVTLAVDKVSQRLLRQDPVAQVAAERGWGTEIMNTPSA